MDAEISRVFCLHACVLYLRPSMKHTLFLVSCLLLVGFGCATKPSSDETPIIDRESILLDAKRNGLIMTEEEKSKMEEADRLKNVEGKNPANIEKYLAKDFTGWNSAALADVTAGGSFGLAFATIENGTYTLVAKMGNLPEPQNGYVYEGWLVKRGEEMQVVNVGVARAQETQHIMIFMSPEDLSDYTFFVLTLEPDDDNTAPAEHILEGTLNE